MAGLGFKQVYGPKVLDGSKQTTIRAKRKRPIKAGEKLYMFTGMRTKSCKRLGEAVVESVSEIAMRKDKYGGVTVVYRKTSDVDFEQIGLMELNKLAIRDGFKNCHEMIEYFDKEHGMPFVGDLIDWGSTFIEQKNVPTWERGARVWGYWLDEKQIGRIGLSITPKYRDGKLLVYYCLLRCNEKEFETTGLKSAKLWVENEYKQYLKEQTPPAPLSTQGGTKEDWKAGGLTYEERKAAGCYDRKK